MKYQGIEIPQSALDAGNAAIAGNFTLDDVRCAVSEILRTLHYDSLQVDFDYGPNVKDVLDDRVADRLIQKAKREGKVRHIGHGRWETIPTQTTDAPLGVDN